MPSPDHNRKRNTHSRRNVSNHSERRLLLSLSTLALLLTVAIFAFVPRSSALTNNGVITTLGTPLTENFDTLVKSGQGIWVNNTTIPGWYHARTGSGTTIVANDGSSSTGSLFSYGTGANTDRALGSVGSGNATAGSFFWGVRLSNSSNPNWLIRRS